MSLIIAENKEYYDNLESSIRSKLATKIGVDERAITPKWLAGQLDIRRNNRPDISDSTPEGKKQLAIKQLAIDTGLAILQGKKFVLTPKGNAFRQHLSYKDRWDSAESSNISSAVDGGYKALRKFMNNEKDKEFREWESSLDSTQKQYLDTFRALDVSDFGFIKTLRELQQKKENYLERIYDTLESNPPRIERLIQGGLINKKDYTINNKYYEGFRSFVNDFTPARLKSASPEMNKASIKVSGDNARDVNSFVRMIHPNAPGESHQTAVGARVWNILNNIPDSDYVDYAQAAKGNHSSTLRDSIKDDNIRQTLDRIARAFPSKNTAINWITTQYNKRQDFKSVERSTDKAVGRNNQFNTLTKI